MDAQERLSFEGWAKLPRFQRKVEQAKAVIREALAIAPAYVAVSWGKNSTVLMHLVQQIQPDIPVISFGHPERELISNYAEVERLYCDRFSPNLTTIEMAGDHVPIKVQKAKLWQQYPVTFVGLRKEESTKRRIALQSHGVIHQYKNGSWRACPLASWKEMDVWAYITVHTLPYLDIYDRGATRTSDHTSKTSKRDYQATRLEEYRSLAPAYYEYLQTNYPEMFHG